MLVAVVVGMKSVDKVGEVVGNETFAVDYGKTVILRYFRDKTQSEIAQELQISQVQVSRLESKVLESLKEKLSL